MSQVVATEAGELENLLALARAGDPEAFCEVCRVHEARLFRQAMSVCGNASVAEELAQETLVEAWKCLGRFNGHCQFFTWLCAILLNRHRNRLRTKRPFSFSALAAREEDDAENILGRMADSGRLPDQALESTEKSEAILACIRALPDKQQQIIFLRFYVDDSLEGIAAAIGCSIGTVKSRLFRALENLREMSAMQEEVAAGRFNENHP